MQASRMKTRPITLPQLLIAFLTGTISVAFVLWATLHFRPSFWSRILPWFVFMGSASIVSQDGRLRRSLTRAAASAGGSTALLGSAFQFLNHETWKDGTVSWASVDGVPFLYASAVLVLLSVVGWLYDRRVSSEDNLTRTEPVKTR